MKHIITISHICTYSSGLVMYCFLKPYTYINNNLVQPIIFCAKWIITTPHTLSEPTLIIDICPLTVVHLLSWWNIKLFPSSSGSDRQVNLCTVLQQFRMVFSTPQYLIKQVKQEHCIISTFDNSTSVAYIHKVILTVDN